MGCEPTGGIGTKTAIGGLGGAAAGGLIAAAVGGSGAGIAAGTILGGLIGGVVGDRREADRAAQRAFETSRSGTQVAWRNPDSGNSGTVIPTRTYQNVSGQYCREYQQEIMIGGQKHQSYGTACREPDGSWRIVQ